jgi:dTDP-glucose 4,6-dehydratase
MNYFNISQDESIKILPLKNSEILVTGGTGFFGKWIVEIVTYLNDELSFNIKLYLVARNNSSYVNAIIENRNDIFFIKNDVRNLREIPSNIEYIIHAAANPDNSIHMSNPIEVMDTISQGTKQVLDIALGLDNIKKILNISSGQVYGKLSSNMISETNIGMLNTNSINSIYPEAKRYSETLSIAYKSLYKLPVVQVRPFSFIGPHMGLEKPWAINNFIKDAIKFKKIKILGNGKPIRSYMYPTDMSWWLLNMLVDSKNGVAYNLGSPEAISLEDLALKIKAKIGLDVNIEILNMNEESSVFVPDDSLVKDKLDLDIKVRIDEALDKTIDWAIKTI